VHEPCQCHADSRETSCSKPASTTACISTTCCWTRPRTRLQQSCWS
jgi:hypothetical protein